MSDGMGREFTYLSSHATNRYFIPNWGTFFFTNKYFNILFFILVAFCLHSNFQTHHTDQQYYMSCTTLTPVTLLFIFIKKVSCT